MAASRLEEGRSDPGEHAANRHAEADEAPGERLALARAVRRRARLRTRGRLAPRAEARALERLAGSRRRRTRRGPRTLSLGARAARRRLRARSAPTAHPAATAHPARRQVQPVAGLWLRLLLLLLLRCAADRGLVEARLRQDAG